ncbi:hypothetical protein PTW37_12920 [Arthrobacter agilis]|uniref:hypothetical protein n=1 Tax=Arthrobacter agilis TaxID=37921 RepID=UPI0023651712|nr:hypothetical protein [Arthrobacter agilis]WDF32750.1 hypothetical protein PTW37_12920 [Arthrobacter agilis]
MSETDQPRHPVRLRRAVAGTFLAAATATSALGFAAAPAQAAPPVLAASATDYDAGDVLLARDAAPRAGARSAVATATGAPSSTERLAGVRAELDQAVLLRMVTSQQADGFYAQIERRVAAGL